MRPLTTGIAAAALLTTVVQAQSPRYLLKDLGPLPGATFSQASDVTDSGIVASPGSGSPRRHLSRGREGSVGGQSRSLVSRRREGPAQLESGQSADWIASDQARMIEDF